MAKLDALAEKFYKLIHRLTGDTVSDASAVAGMSINEVCDKLQEEIGNGNLDLVDELAELTDVALATPANGQVLTYDGTAGKWKNADASGGGSSAGAVYITYASTLDQSFNDIKDLVDAGNVVCIVKSDGNTDGYYYLSQLADVISLAGSAIVSFYGCNPETGTMETIAFSGTTLDAPLSRGS